MNFNKLKHFFIHKYIATVAKRERYYLCYNYEYKVIWYRVAKVASRTINEHLKENTAENKYIYSSPVGVFPQLLDDYFKFAFVRNPIDRFLSAWRNKVKDENYFNFNKATHKKMQDIDNYIAWVSTLDIEDCDEHLQSQNSLIDLNNVDFIGRFENFSEDFKIIADKIELPIEDIKWKNKSKKQDISLSKSQIHQIKNIYKKDLQIFYPSELF